MKTQEDPYPKDPVPGQDDLYNFPFSFLLLPLLLPTAARAFFSMFMFRPYGAWQTRGDLLFYRYAAPPGHMIFQKNPRLLCRSGEAACLSPGQAGRQAGTSSQ